MKDLSRRDLLAVAGAALIAPQAAEAGVFAPNIVKYQTAAGEAGHQCKGCKMFIPGASADAAGTCKSVSGEINPNGWCKLWTDQQT